MASSIISISASSPPLHLNPSQPPPIILHSPTSPPPLHFSGGGHLFCRRRKTHRGMSVVTRGAPGPSTYIFAFVFPLSLLAVTIFTSIRIADKLDQDFLEELAINQSILEEAEEEDFNLFMEEEAATPRTRNRPKREAATEPPSSV